MKRPIAATSQTAGASLFHPGDRCHAGPAHPMGAPAGAPRTSNILTLRPHRDGRLAWVRR